MISFPTMIFVFEMVMCKKVKHFFPTKYMHGTVSCVTHLNGLLVQAAQCSLVQNIYFGLQKIGSLCPKNRRKIGNYRPKMAFL